MKRAFVGLLALLLCFALAAPALADVISEPWGNDFFQDHRREATPERRYYYTNGPQGFVTLYREPEGKRIATLANGEAYFIQFLIQWKGSWGVMELQNENGEFVSGWVPMAQMVEKYDTVSFVRDHAGELTTPEEPLQVELLSHAAAAIWDFPGAETPYTVVVPGELESYAWFQRDGKAEFSLLYTDPLDRVWGRIEDSRFYSGLWVCLDAPEETEAAFVDEKAAAKQAGEGLIPPAEELPGIRFTEDDASGFPWLALGLTVGAVVLALLLLLLFRKKKAAKTPL